MKPEILMPGPMLQSCMDALDAAYTVHRLWAAPDPAALLSRQAPGCAPSPRRRAATPR